MSSGLEITPVTETIKQMESCENALIHSDQGFHYTSPLFIEIVQGLGMIQSMSIVKEITLTTLRLNLFLVI